MSINLFIKHRVNTIEELKKVPQEYGIELDLRADGERIILHHDPFVKGEDFGEFLKHYYHKFIILNCKCEGMEGRLIDLMSKHNISDYFFLDLSIPFLLKTSKAGCRKIAVRFSEFEPIEFVENFNKLAEWVWVDCFTKNILTPDAYSLLKPHFKICIVSPELQGYPLEYIHDFKNSFSNFEIDAVCTKQPELWK